MRHLLAATIWASFLWASAGQAAEPHPRLMRFPDVHDHQVVFSYAGDLWIASTDGGLARQLTSAPGMEMFPKFSPDGRWVAYTGQAGGDEQVYVAPVEGGTARQLTYYPARGPLTARLGYDNQVTGWSPDGTRVLFRSLRDQPATTGSRLYTVPFAGGTAVALPLARAGAGVFSPDGKQVLFSPIFADFRTWKRYQGGLAQDLYVADLDAKTLRNVTHHPRTDRDPMWTRAGVYFLSDRDGRLNLYRMGQPGETPQQLTRFKDGDAKFASADTAGRVVYEYEGALRLYDPASGGDRRLDIMIPADDRLTAPRTVKVADQTERAVLSPKGDQVLVVARGDLFVMPASGDGAVLSLTHSSNAHEREAAWSPDGRTIAYISDVTGEEALWTLSATGAGAARHITQGDDGRYYNPVWSPDGRKIALLDKAGNLLVVDMATGAKRTVGATKAWYARQYAWSPDSRFLAFTELQPTNLGVIRIWDEATGRSQAVTDPLYDAFEPTWSGDYLWFLSIRDANLQISETEWNYAPTRQTRIYGLAMRPDVANPFLAQPPAAGSGAAPVAGGDLAKAGAVVLEGLAERLIRVPVEVDNYVDLEAAAGRLTYRVVQPRQFGQERDESALFVYDLGERRARKLRDDVVGYTPNGDGTVFLVRAANRDQGLLRLQGEVAKLDLSRLSARVDPRQEWATIFDEVWRRYRDYFYDPGMGGHDWKAIGDHYRRRLPEVADRAGLNYLIGEMIGELGISHAYISGGADEVPPRPRTGLLGARLVRDGAGGDWRIAKIFEGDNADPLYRSPLTEFGSKAVVGDYLFAIDGQPTRSVPDPYVLLAGKAGQVVQLLVGPTPAQGRTVRIRTLDSEAPLLQLERTLAARRTLDRLSDGRIGYIHISDMGPAGLKAFAKDWYGQIRKDGMVVDIRGNLGGNVSRMILERLLRPDHSRGYVQGVQNPQTYPWGGYTQVFTGRLALLIDETTMSDGDAMAWTFQKVGAGPLIGKRSWGGVIGTGDTGPLLDGGFTQVPQFAFTGRDGEWVVEGQGVSPDIEVDFDQPALASGEDAQLTTAAKALAPLITGRPGQLRGPQPYPARP